MNMIEKAFGRLSFEIKRLLSEDNPISKNYKKWKENLEQHMQEIDREKDILNKI